MIYFPPINEHRLDLGWCNDNTKTLASVYDYIDKAEILGVTCKDLLTKCCDMVSSESTIEFRDYLQVLVDEQLVSELNHKSLRGSI